MLTQDQVPTFEQFLLIKNPKIKNAFHEAVERLNGIKGIPQLAHKVATYEAVVYSALEACWVVIHRVERRKKNRDEKDRLDQDILHHNRRLNEAAKLAGKKVVNTEVMIRAIIGSTLHLEDRKGILNKAREISMNFGSAEWYLSMRDYLSGDRSWTQCQPIVIEILSKGDAGKMAEMQARHDADEVLYKERKRLRDEAKKLREANKRNEEAA